jgi:ribosomal protein S11
MTPSGIEVIKASAWEQPFAARIAVARTAELATLRTVLLLQVRVCGCGCGYAPAADDWECVCVC